MGLSIEFWCLACTCGCADWGHLSDICCQRAREKFAAGNAFVSGDWRSSRWCTVEVSSHRLGCRSVMTVREKCDERGLRWNQGKLALCAGSHEAVICSTVRFRLTREHITVRVGLQGESHEKNPHFRCGWQGLP